MSVRKRNKKWIVDIEFKHPNGSKERVRRVSPVQTKRSAEKYEREIRQALLDGTFETAKEVEEIPSFKEFSKEFLEIYATANNKWSEVLNKRRMLDNHLLSYFGHLRLDKIGERDIEGFKALKLRAGISNKTINNYLACIRRILAVAKEWQIIENIPSIKWMKTSLPDVDFLTFAEADLLVKNAETDWRAMILTALKTGMRHGELLELRWHKDINFDLGLIKLSRAMLLGKVGKPKNSKSREIPICDELMQTLIDCYKKRKSDLVFSNVYGRQLTAAQCRRPLERSCAKAGLRPISWHVFRHTFASHLVMKGAPLKVVQELLGHSTIAMTLRYSHLSPDARYDAVQLLNRCDPPNEPFLHGSGTIAAQKNGELCNSPFSLV